MTAAACTARSFVRSRYPGYERYLRQADDWCTLTPVTQRRFDRRARSVPEIFRGLRERGVRTRVADDAAGRVGVTGDADQRAETGSTQDAAPWRSSATEGCTVFGVSGAVTRNGHPIASQTKDVAVSAAELFVVVRMRLIGGPTVLVLAYPGEVLGLGLWSTGMSLFRNSLISTGSAPSGLSMEQWGLLALAGSSIGEAVELAARHGIRGQGSHPITDRTGAACSVEYNVGGIGILEAQDGVVTHGNHPEAAQTWSHEHLTWKASERENSRYRMYGLRELLIRERGA